MSDARTTKTPFGITCEMRGSEYESFRVLHYVIDGVRRNGMRLPSMDAWIIDEGSEDHPYAYLVVLQPIGKGWPEFLFSALAAFEGVAIDDIVQMALDEYAAKHGVELKGARLLERPS